MDRSIPLFVRLFILIVNKLLNSLMFKTCNNFFSFAYNFCRPVTLVNFAVAQLQQHYFAYRRRPKTVGLVILTRFSFNLSSERPTTYKNIKDPLQTAALHPCLLERILTELTARCVASWLLLDNAARDLSVNLFLVYRRALDNHFSLSGWLSTLPDHNKAALWYRKWRNLESESYESRVMHILSTASHNVNRQLFWENRTLYYDSPDSFEKSSSVQFCNNIVTSTEPSFEPMRQKPTFPKIEYISIAEAGYDSLLEVALLAAMRSKSDYVIILNPRVFALRPEHIDTTIRLLSENVDLVLGVSRGCSDRRQSRSSYGSSPSRTRSYGSLDVMGLYLLGIRGSPSLTLRAHSLAASVEWSSPSAAFQIWSNILRSADNWTAVCLRDRLEALLQPVDLLGLESHLGILPEQFLEDTITVIIPVGPGHPDDGLDLLEDFELIDVDRSKALALTVEILTHNATGHRSIQVILIDSGSTSSLLDGIPQFRGLDDCPSVTVSLHRFPHTDLDNPTLPRRGELIRYAVNHFARGAISVFLEPGTQLPYEWDSFVYHSLQHPGVGLGCFAYRLHLHDAYINRKSVTWAVNCWLANFFVNIQAHRTELPIVGQPLFMYTHYLACLGGYPPTSRALHSIDLALLCRKHIGRMFVTCPKYASAGVPAEFAFRHGAYRTTLYTLSLALARYLGATQSELSPALSVEWRARRGEGSVDLSHNSMLQHE